MRIASPAKLLLTACAPPTERIAGWPTEVIREGDGPLRIVFVPGNPGVASFYQSTAAALAESLDASTAVVSFSGHSMRQLVAPTRAFGLAEQVDHVTAFLEGELATAEGDVVVVGHSIGAWVALEAVRRAGPQRVAACVGLMPYLQSETPSVLQKASLALKWWMPPLIWLMAAVAQLIGWLPRAQWRRAAMGVIEPALDTYESEQRDIAIGCMPRFGTMLNVLSLFRSEAASHAVPYDYAKLDGWRERVGLLYTDKDMWAPLEGAARSKAAGLLVHTESGLPHAFGTNPTSRSAVVAWVTQTVGKLRGGACAPQSRRTARTVARRGARSPPSRRA